MRRGRVLLAVAAVLAASGVWRLRPGAGDFDLPARIPIEEVLADLSSTLDPATVIEQAPNDPVRLGGLRPGHELELNGGYRQALVASPPARLRFRTRVPAGTQLRFGIGVDMGDVPTRDPEVAGVRFIVEVDGHALFARTVAPARTRYDRRWFDADVPLPDGDVERDVVLRTELSGGGPRSPRAAGWSHVRLVHATTRERQPGGAVAPNVLVLLVDTLRADALGCYGATPSMTPILDTLAGDGLVFEEMVSQSSWTMPAVATLLTGLHPQSHGVLGRGAEGGAEPDQAFLSDVLPVLPEVAERAGITTVAVSANPVISRDTNFARGFETFVEAGWDPGRKNWLPAAEVNARFADWLRANRRHRFLGYLHYMEPHDPYTPSPTGRPPAPAGAPPAIAAGDVAPLSRKLRAGAGTPLPAAELAYVRKLYNLEVRDWDAALAGLLATLGEMDVRDSTVLVVVGDHGEEFQEHGLLKHGVHLYDELLHVPLVIAGPGLGHGRVRGQVQGIDLFPTLAALLGVTPPPGLPGQNLLRGATPQPAFSSTRFGIAPDGRSGELVSVRAGGWKLIHAPALGVTELFDLAHDPEERRSVLRTAPEEGERLAALLAAWHATAPPPPPIVGRDPRIGEKLRALGYVE